MINMSMYNIGNSSYLSDLSTLKEKYIQDLKYDIGHQNRMVNSIFNEYMLGQYHQQEYYNTIKFEGLPVPIPQPSSNKNNLLLLLEEEIS